MGRLISYVIAYVVMVFVNVMAEWLPLNGQTTGEISRKVNVLFTPAGYVFSIWGFIYVLLAIWIFRQIPTSRRHLSMYQKAFIPFVVSCMLNALWIVVWHYEYFIFSVIVMLSLLLTLIWLYKVVKRTNPRFFDLFPFSIYLSWISVATIANISFVLKYNGWDGFGLSDAFWAIAMLLVATALSLLFMHRQRDYVYPLVFVWAFVGIGVKNQGAASLVAYVSFLLAGVILISTASLYKEKT
ncbi:tryptophan-rich sensory protein [Anoxybacillus flavithermus]|uniref:Tryptophan-rich sensory protein n=1 Tax=Anoxybacillus flavithermus TaxID=33934 RepID=A0A2G5RMM8_9BACL|nr:MULTISPECIES: TspO/MBR family protein [Anoxybacillus]KFZ43500.1 membrane protein [Anoxybacillus sp. KU2-6(11)]PIC04064.1 tryptophan-rich sensory protein [Anoxybacillus flavithermus]